MTEHTEGLAVAIGLAVDAYDADDGNAAQAGSDLSLACASALAEFYRGKGLPQTSRDPR